MKKFIDCVLKQWLEIEYYKTAKKARFISYSVKVEHRLVLDTIRCLDYMTTVNKDKYKNYVITVVALMWEHIDKNIYNIKDVILKMLSRIGYPTSAIIIDDEYDKSDGKFLKPSSIFDMLTLTLEQQKNEIAINKQSFLLTDFQKIIWDAMGKNKFIGISAPTSAGKSFVLLIKTISKIITDKIDVVYIVPTLSLLNQVTEDYNKMLKKIGLLNYKIVNSFMSDNISDYPTIYVLTQEKAIGAFCNQENAFSKKLILIIDEIQNIERINNSNDLRAKILYDALIEFRQKANIEQIVISGPRIDDIDDIGEKIFGDATLELKTLTSPVLNLTYSVKKEKSKYYFKQYCGLLSENFSREIVNAEYIAGYGKKQYNDEYNAYLKTFINNIGEDNQNIIFAPTSNTAKDIAMAISTEGAEAEGYLADLIKYYADTISVNYAMCHTLHSGVGYHHGKLPMHVRRTLEKAISDKLINNVVCTTTLMQGVNMPAQNVIIRNPHLYINKKNDGVELSSYEMANLRGRAGRLLKDFVGRTFVLDESSFEGLDEYDQKGLFEDTTLEIPVGYGEKYEEFKDLIHDAIDSNKSVDNEMKKYGYLVSYIRQTVLRYGYLARERMDQVGISLTKDQVATIICKLNELNVPKSVCSKNRYWDPLVLNTIYNEFDIKHLPNTPRERGAKTRLKDILKFLRDNPVTSFMYNCYIPEVNKKGLGRAILCSACIDWSCEKPLSNILVGERYKGDNATENIDKTIELLQQTVSFNVPLLLKPIFDMFNEGSIFLLCMQTGAYKPFTRRMIEIGTPRETAIYLNTLFFEGKKPLSDDASQIENQIISVITKNYDKLPYWIKVQLDFMV